MIDTYLVPEAPQGARSAQHRPRAPPSAIGHAPNARGQQRDRTAPLQPAVRFTQINNAVLIILSHLVPEHAGFDDSTSGGVTVASAADHLHENDVLGTAEELKSVREKVGARRRAKQLE